MSAPTIPPRRTFLAALSAFVAAPAAAATPALAAAVQPEPPVEAPELLALGEELRARLATYRAAAARFAAARETYERIKPVPPDELILPLGVDRDTMGLSSRDLDLDGAEIMPPRRVYDGRSLQVHIIVQTVSRTTKEGRRLRRLARLAKAYEAAKDAAAREAGYWEAHDAASLAACRITDLTHRLLQAEPVTPAGVRSLAEACAAIWEARDRIGPQAYTHTSALGLHLAGVLLRLDGGST